MAIYRQIQTTFWQDDFILNLTPEEKYFYLFLLTNSKTKQCGIYQLPIQVIVFETGYNQETIDKLLHRFIDYGKIIYSNKTKEIGIVNWQKYNPAESPKVKACVNKELKEIKDHSLIDKIYPMDRLSQEEQEEEKEKKPAEEEKAVPSAVAAVIIQFWKRIRMIMITIAIASMTNLRCFLLGYGTNPIKILKNTVSFQNI